MPSSDRKSMRFRAIVPTFRSPVAISFPIMPFPFQRLEMHISGLEMHIPSLETEKNMVGMEFIGIVVVKNQGESLPKQNLLLILPRFWNQIHNPIIFN